MILGLSKILYFKLFILKNIRKRKNTKKRISKTVELFRFLTGYIPYPKSGYCASLCIQALSAHLVSKRSKAANNAKMYLWID